jgi:hypothetical protein
LSYLLKDYLIKIYFFKQKNLLRMTHRIKFAPPLNKISNNFVDFFWYNRLLVLPRK